MTRTRWAGLGTVLYLGVIAYLRGSDAWFLLREGELNVLGDFLAGIFTPLAFLWLVVGYFLQKDEFQTLSSQAEADRWRSMPMLCLEKDDSLLERPDGAGGFEQEDSPDPNRFLLRNLGGPARNLEITIGTDDVDWPAPPPVLDKDKTCPVDISNPFYPPLLDSLNPDTDEQPTDDQPISCRVRFTSERHERLEQRWSIRFTGKISYVEIKPTTEGPIPTATAPPPSCRT